MALLWSFSNFCSFVFPGSGGCVLSSIFFAPVPVQFYLFHLIPMLVKVDDSEELGDPLLFQYDNGIENATGLQVESVPYLFFPM